MGGVFMSANFQEGSVDVAEGNPNLPLTFDQTEKRNFVCELENGQITGWRVLGDW
jgi:hypothetical protein